MPKNKNYKRNTYVNNLNPQNVKLRILFSWSAMIFAGYGMFQFALLHPVASTPFMAAYFYIILYLTTSYIISLNYYSFDLKKHYNKTYTFSKKSTYPTIDIFLPICGEPYEILYNTWTHVQNLKYPNIKVYVLDDKGNEEHKSLALEMGFNYISRYHHGHYKKAGNLRHAFKRTAGEFIIIFDADFAPSQEFIMELLPYMKNPEIGIVQSPQCFNIKPELHADKPLKYGASVIQEDFYAKTQVARNKFNGSICVGSNAIYRRSALKKIGGPVKVCHSEDVHTGFGLISKGYRIEYIPLRLAFGECPDKLGAWIKQQMRWCQGSLSLLLSKKFWRAKINIFTKISYFSGFLYYASSLFKLVVPYFIFLVFFSIGPATSLYSIVYFVPIIISGWFIFPFFRTNKFKSSFLYAYWMLIYIHSYTIIKTTILKKDNPWFATAAGNIGNQEKNDVLNMIKADLGTKIIITIVWTIFGFINLTYLGSYFLLLWIIIEIAKLSWLLAFSYIRVERASQWSLLPDTIFAPPLFNKQRYNIIRNNYEKGHPAAKQWGI